MAIIYLQAFATFLALRGALGATESVAASGNLGGLRGVGVARRAVSAEEAAAEATAGAVVVDSVDVSAGTIAAPSSSSSSSKRKNKRQRRKRRNLQEATDHDQDGYYLRLDKTTLSSPDESLEVKFKLPPSAALGTRDHSEWKIGVYMRQANPQDGALDPITSLKLCGLATCLHKDVLHDGTSEDGSSVTFSVDSAEHMSGRDPGWPVDSGYGTGYDVFLLDDLGVAVLGPIPFVIDPDAGDDADAAEDASVTEEDTTSATFATTSSLVTTKTEYDEGASLEVHFSLGTDLLTANEPDDIANWRVGIYMRHADPQNGSLPPIVSLPLCGYATSCTSGDVVFDADAMLEEVGDWPIDTNQYGTGFDTHILDEFGSSVVKGSEFNVHLLEKVEDEPDTSTA